MGFHAKGEGRGRSAALNREEKSIWSEPDTPTLPLFTMARIASVGVSSAHPKSCHVSRTVGLTSDSAHASGLAHHLLFSGRGYRRRGVANRALGRAVQDTSQLGGGRIEGYPEDTQNRRVSGSFLFNGALSMFERQGFERTRLIGKYMWVVARNVT